MNRTLAAIVSTFLLCFTGSSGAASGADASAAVDPGTAALIELLPQLPDDQARLDILKGIRAGLLGQREVAPPQSWKTVYQDHLARSQNADVRELAQLLALQFGDDAVRDKLFAVLADETAELARRRSTLDALAEVRAEGLPDLLHKLLQGSALRPDALRVLAEFSSSQTPGEIINAYTGFDADEKRIAVDVLSSDVAAAHALFDAIASGTIPASDVNAETIRRLKLLGDESLDEAIEAHWGTARETPEAKAERIVELKELLTSPAKREPDLARGRALFAKTCRQCHVLYGDGEKVGPDITGSNRADLDYLLLNVVDPNSTVGKDYQAWSVMTDAGKLHVGLVLRDDPQALTVRTQTDTITIPKEEIEYQEQTPVSMMPEGLFDQFSEADLRDLVAYLRTNAQVPLISTEETADQPLASPNFSPQRHREH